MANSIKISELRPFDMAEHLLDEQSVADYLTVVLEENDPAALAQAFGLVQRQRADALRQQAESNQ